MDGPTESRTRNLNLFLLGNRSKHWYSENKVLGQSYLLLDKKETCLQGFPNNHIKQQEQVAAHP